MWKAQVCIEFNYGDMRRSEREKLKCVPPQRTSVPFNLTSFNGA